jgi:monovalent cation/hydrogen antiporter
MMTPVAQFEFVLALLVAVLVLSVLARKLRLPPAAAFILGGAALALTPGVPALELDPGLVLVLFLPPLLMSSAFLTVWRDFRANIVPILMLAVGAVLFTTLVVGVVAHAVVPGLPWAVCFALGAIVSPPDAVAAEAVLERVNLPKRLVALLQGESLLNDAAGLVLFRFAVAAALTGTFHAGEAAAVFAGVTLGGIAVGVVVGLASSFVLRRIREVDFAITVTLLAPWAAYIGGEQAGASGVLATVVAGMVIGWRQHEDMSAAIRLRSRAFWGVMVFVLESLVFILIGLSLRGVLARIGSAADAAVLLGIAAAVVASVVLARFAWIFASVWVRRALPGNHFRPSYAAATVASWAGMRGVVTLAAALSLPDALPGRDTVIFVAFVVILVTVLVQGSTLGPLIRMLGAEGIRTHETVPETGLLREEQAWARIAHAQLAAIQAESRQQDGSERHPRLLEQYTHRARISLDYAADRDALRPREIEHFQAVLAAIRAGRAEALRMHRAGEIHDHVLTALEQELDLQELEASQNIQ